MYVFEDVSDTDFDIITTIVRLVFAGSINDDFQRCLVWGYHDIIWIMKYRYKLSYKEQLFVLFKMAEYSDTIAYMKAYKCSYKNAQKNAHKMKNRPYISLAVHEVERVACACIVNASFNARIANIERQYERDFGSYSLPVDEINEKIANGEHFKWTSKRGFVCEKDLDEDPYHDNADTVAGEDGNDLSEMEREELERLREENKALITLVQEQERDIYALNSIIEGDKSGATLTYGCKGVPNFRLPLI